MPTPLTKQGPTRGPVWLAWKRLSTKYKDILGPLSVHLEKADLGTKGTYFRVQAGPFTDKAAAKDVCVKLKAKGQPCLVKP